MFDNILIVCVGNICRSPTAEMLLKQRLANTGKTIHSAGLHALQGKDMDATARAVLLDHGIDAAPHVARQISADLIAQADLVLAMETKHLKQLHSIAPQARGKTFLLGKWLNNKEVPDPYRQEKPAFEHTYKVIEQSVTEWMKHLL